MENDETLPLGAHIENAVDAFATQGGGGFLTGFLCIVERVDADGQQCLTITAPNGQMTWRSLGLATYLREWYLDDAHNEMSAWTPTLSEDED